MKKVEMLVILLVLACLIMAASTMAEGLKVGLDAPFFNIKSGSDEQLTLDIVKGKIIVIFYETKDVAEKNRKLKSELNKSYHELSDTQKTLIVRLPVINCSSAFWPISEIWKSKLRENTKKEGLTIFGDWNGKMLSEYRMKDKESNFVVIDKKGIIQYFSSGRIEDSEIAKIKGLLEELIYER
jgi:predicted transcriptional regulator